jgi:hypothetical protein
MATTDRLRLDGGLAADREIYSCVGASKFEDSDIDEIVPIGAALIRTLIRFVGLK